MSFKLPELTYSYEALEPHIDALTMETHHSKHHAGYVSKLNEALTSHSELLALDIKELLQQLNQLPEAIQTAVRNNGGGHYNHTLFWELMSPNPKNEPTGELARLIHDTFGSLDGFKDKLKQAALAQFGSGWAWLIIENGKLSVTSTPNQDSPVSEGKEILLGIDVWEHAYYLKYMNKRPDYVDAWWSVLDWAKVEERFNQFK
ncbi:MAG: superoxide dismutase [Bacillota bacterium]|nr:superoxide dismutase [Bacillota bacterium]MDW7677987.1 superoxide dismutase [Bacillota bacterium]